MQNHSRNFIDLIVILSAMTLYFIQVYIFYLNFEIAWIFAGCMVLAIIMLTKSMRPDFTQSLTAKNLALGVFVLKLILVPLSITVYGFKFATLFYIPSDVSIYESYNLIALSFFCFSIGWTIFYKNRDSAIRNHNLHDKMRTPLGFGVLLLIIGIVGMIMRYNSLNAYLNSIYVDYQSSVPSVMQFIGSLFKPLAVFGIAVIWENLISRSKIDIYRILLTLCACILIVFFSLNSNRAAIAYPLIAFIAMVSVKYRPLGILPLTVIFMLSLPIISAFGDVRANNRSNSNSNSMDSKIGQFQVYFGAPQFIAPMLETDLGDKFSTIKSSLLESLPVVGEPFRYTSGSYVYNQVIYRNLIVIVRDQVYPVVAESFKNFGFAGVIIIHIMIGMIYCKMDSIYISRMQQGVVSMALFLMILYFNASIALSFSVLSQFLIYNAGAPAIVIWGFAIFKSRTTRLRDNR